MEFQCIMRAKIFVHIRAVAMLAKWDNMRSQNLHGVWYNLADDLRGLCHSEHKFSHHCWALNIDGHRAETP